MAGVCLLFEASTPFMHARLSLIAADAAKGPLFSVVQLLFAATFFATRIAYGYWRCLLWWISVERLLAAGAIHSVPMLRVYQAACIFLCGLNGFWFSKMLAMAFGGGKGREKGVKAA